MGQGRWGRRARMADAQTEPEETIYGRCWSTFGPHAIGAERFATVSSGLQR
jgi:hypothetical protein